MALLRQRLGVEVALDQALQDGVEHGIGRQRVGVLLVGAQLGRRRLVEDALRDRPAARVAPAAELEHRGLVDVLQDVEAAVHVAVERGVAHRHLRLVAGGHHHAAELVRHGHQGDAPRARLDVLLGHVLRAIAEQRRQHGAERLHRRADVHDVVADAQRPGAGLGVLQRVPAGVGRRHHDGVHALRPQRVGGDGRGERRIDATGKADHHRREAGLVHVVAQAQHHRPVDRLDVAQLRCDGAGRDLPAFLAARELHRRHLLGEGGELHFQRTIRAQREGAAVVDDLVLAADLVEIDKGQAALDHTPDAELHAHVGLADLVGRGVGHQQDLAAGLGDALHDVGGPHVLADRHAEAHAAEHQRPRHRARRKHALVVEHAVVRQVDLEAPADDLASVERDDGVVEPAVLVPRRGDEQRRAAVRRIGAQRLDRLVAAPLEGGLQHQVLGKVAGQHQLGEQHEIGALRLGLGARGPHPGEVAGDVADLGIELGEAHLEGVGHCAASVAEPAAAITRF